VKDRQIVNPQEMKQLDKLTIQETNITSYDLLYQAGTALFNHIFGENYQISNESILVIAGIGKNGGDALVISKHLFDRGIDFKIIVVGEDKNQADETSVILEKILKNGIKVVRVDDYGSVNDARDLIDNTSLIIDGIFGIGLNRKVAGYHKEIIELINGSYAKKISIDIPSGINANNGVVEGVAVLADETIVIQNYKQGNLLNDARDYCGEVTLLDVGILQMLFMEPQLILSKAYLKNKIPKRKHNSYKYNYGNILTIGGSKGMMGAPLMSAYTSLRTGTGLSHVSYNEKYAKYINNVYPEIMVDTFSGIEDIPSQTQNKTAIIFGPGLGKNDELNLEILTYLLSIDTPLIIDADGIYYLGQVIQDYSDRKNIIITPHNKEMATFLDVDIEEVIKEPVLLSKNIAHKYNLTVVLKGTCTIITNNDETYFSTHGNPGLATAGTGDILTGIIGSLLGRGFSPIESSKIGVLIHSIAADLASKEYGEESLIASDICKYIPKVLKNI